MAAWWEDVLQEALFRIARDVPGCAATTDGGCWAWAIAVAWHAAVDALGAPSAAAALVRSAVPLEPVVADAMAWREFASVAAMLDEPAADAHAQLARLTVDAQASLSPDATTVLWLRLVQGSAWYEIGGALGTTAAGAKRRFQRAQAALRRAVLAAIERLPPDERATVERALREYPAVGGAS